MVTKDDCSRFVYVCRNNKRILKPKLQQMDPRCKEVRKVLVSDLTLARD